MTIGTNLLEEFEREMATTRRLLERVPEAKGTWKPHPKSFALGHLAQLVVWMPGWIASAVTESELDLAKAPPYSFETTAALLDTFDHNVRDASAALRAAKDDGFAAQWTLTRAGQPLFSTTRGTIVRMHINHLIHHRGQLTVYLRLVDVPLPPIYGPTADERMTA